MRVSGPVQQRRVGHRVDRLSQMKHLRDVVDAHVPDDDRASLPSGPDRTCGHAGGHLGAPSISRRSAPRDGGRPLQQAEGDTLTPPSGAAIAHGEGGPPARWHD